MSKPIVAKQTPQDFAGSKKSNPPPEGQKRLVVNMTEEQHERLKNYAKGRLIPMGVLVRQFIDAGLERKD